MDAQPDGLCIVVRFSPRRGGSAELEDRIPLGPPEELPAVRGVGRLLRILRAGRIQPPPSPYELETDPEAAAELVRRCRGSVVTLEIAQRVERVLTVWTDAGVDRIRGVVDVEENREGLSVRRRGALGVLRIPRSSLVRFSVTSSSFPEVVDIEVPSRSGLHSKVGS